MKRKILFSLFSIFLMFTSVVSFSETTMAIPNENSEVSTSDRTITLDLEDDTIEDNIVIQYGFLKYGFGQGLKEVMTGSRPYAVLSTQIEGSTFAIPFRTGMKLKHRYDWDHFLIESFETYSGSMVTGLDYSKAVIIDKNNDISYLKIKDINKSKKSLNKEQIGKIDRNKDLIVSNFEEYVSYYIDEPENRRYNYKFSTLVNYHNELGIK